MDHPVVAGRHADRDGAPRDVGTCIDRVDVRGQKAGARLRLVDGRDAVLCECVDDRSLSAADVPDDDAYFHGSSETWMTPFSTSPPTALIARSASSNPNSCVVSRWSGNRFEASCAIASSTAR